MSAPPQCTSLLSFMRRRSCARTEFGHARFALVAEVDFQPAGAVMAGPIVAESGVARGRLQADEGLVGRTLETRAKFCSRR